MADVGNFYVSSCKVFGKKRDEYHLAGIGWLQTKDTEIETILCTFDEGAKSEDKYEENDDAYIQSREYLRTIEKAVFKKRRNEKSADRERNPDDLMLKEDILCRETAHGGEAKERYRKRRKKDDPVDMSEAPTHA